MVTESVPPVPPTNTQYTDRFAKAAHKAVDQAAMRSAQAEERWHRTSDRYSDQSRQARDWINDHPYAAVGLALAGGYLIAKMLRRR